MSDQDIANAESPDIGPVDPVSEAPDWVDGAVVAIKDALDPSQMDRLLAQSKLIRDEPWVLQSIMSIKDGIFNDDPMAVREAWAELTEEQQNTLWLAPTYGGLFTTSERTYIKTMGSE
jgi:hypothetical protein